MKMCLFFAKKMNKQRTDKYEKSKKYIFKKPKLQRLNRTQRGSLDHLHTLTAQEGNKKD